MSVVTFSFKRLAFLATITSILAWGGGCSTVAEAPSSQYSRLKAELEQKFRLLDEANFVWVHREMPQGRSFISQEVDRAEQEAEVGNYERAVDYLKEAMYFADVAVEQMKSQSRAGPAWE